jgi:Uma2 family endonuclease
LLRVPDHLIAEIVAGDLYATPRPTPHHAYASTALGGTLYGPFDRGLGGPGGWWILFEPELHLGHDILVPDCAGWRRERLAALPDEAFFSVAPDWVCEVLSPSTAALDRVGKLNVYARAGVPFTWLIDPVAQTLEVLRLEAGRWVIVCTFAGTESVRVPPFDAIEWDLGALWGGPRPLGDR